MSDRVEDDDVTSTPEDPHRRIEILLAAAAGPRASAATAQTFIREWNSFSHPVAVSCDDGLVYVVKGRQVGRGIVNEQVVARIGIALGAPVGEPALIEIPQALIDVEPRLGFLSAGLAHGNRFVSGCSDRLWIDHTSVAENRARFALLAVLYGWCSAGDSQLIYPNAPPHLVLSVDHGHFFPGGPDWQRSNLDGAAHAVLDAGIVSGCGLTTSELNEGLAALGSVTEADIISAVSMPPDDWGLGLEDRVSLVNYLSRRQQELLALAPLT